jgi:histidyl-tRNA synthetase
MNKLSTESYKGVRDFYPKDQLIQNYIFDIMRKTVESFGYEEYNASILEPAELYKAKTGEEIVNNETYTFKDRGDREVTLRPEMTPTVARMVANKQKELVFPLRWYSIPNLFRYEKPQKGRLREHYQLNVDIFGVENIFADVEIIKIGHKIMENFGAKDSDFVIFLNNRKILDELFERFELRGETKYKVSKIIDKKEKISKEDFENLLQEFLKEKTKDFIEILVSTDRLIDFIGKENESIKKLTDLLEKLKSAGVNNALFKPTLMRGFDYYTDIIFEFFDTSKENNRSLFGGGRYDDLLDIFGKEKVPAFGFGMGDVTAKDFLETHNLLPKLDTKIDLYICPTNQEYLDEAFRLSDYFRNQNLIVSVDITEKKLGDKLKYADKKNIPFVIVLGEDEIKSSTLSLKNMNTSEEFKVNKEEVMKFF